jgi:hypothetical protein
MTLLIAFGDGDGFVELAFLEGAGNLLHEDTGLLARRTVHQRAVNHDAEGIDGKDEQNKHHDERESTHRVQHAAQIPAGGRLLQHQG